MKIILQIEATEEEMKEHDITFADMKEDALELKDMLTPEPGEKVLGRASVILLDHYGNPIPFEEEAECTN